VSADQLFLEILTDLEARLQPGASEYQVLGISFLLRMLLLDGLAQTVSEAREIPLVFVVNDRQPVWKAAGSDPPEVWAIADGFDPDTAAAAVVPREMTLDEMLAQIVIMVQGLEITMKDALTHALYFSGGAHPPKASKRKKGEALSELDATFFIGEYPAALRALLPMGRVVLKGLAPLRAWVQAGS